MKKILRLLGLVLAILIMVFPNQALARNEIYNIDMTVTLHEDGSATFVQDRSFNIDDGTEHYIVFSNLGNSELLDYKVYENGVELQDIGEWDINASIEEKSGKYGINYTPDGFELCFGVGSHGRKDFRIEYKFSNVVRNLQDGPQAVYWKLINDNMDPTYKVNIRVANDFGHKFTQDQTKIWGFGYEGTVELTDDAILMDSGDSFRTDNYMVLLSIFEDSPFQASASYDYSSTSILETAMEGASLDGMTYEDYIENSSGGQSSPPASNDTFSPRSGIFRFMPFLTFIPMVFPIMAFIFIFSFIRKGASGKAQRSQFFKPTDESSYYRDIPVDYPFYLTNEMVGATTSEYVSAFILKWVAEGRLSEEKEIEGIFRKREVLGLKIEDYSRLQTSDMVELKLWEMVKKASGSDGVLSEREFDKYVAKNISQFNKWVKEIEAKSEQYQKKVGNLEDYDDKFLIFPITKTRKTPSGQQLVDNIHGFKNYLENYSLLNEKDVSHVNLWDQYMIWAAYLGIADKVYEQLKISNPSFETQTVYTPTMVTGVNSFGRSAYSAQRSANSSSSSSSFGGGGGSSFSGGGGGSSGGGSGGGSR